MQIVDPEVFIQLILSATFGGLIGIERQIQGQTAGFRTQLLVCLGACLFTITSIKFFEIYGKTVDPSRISAQIVVGIGFLGAGAIIKQGDFIRGLTTAATLWVVSAIGVAIGIEDYTVATFATFVTLINLIILKRIENILPKDIYSQIEIEFDGWDFSDINIPARKHSIEVTNLKESYDKQENKTVIVATLKYKKSEQLKKLLNTLREEPFLKKIIVR